MPAEPGNAPRPMFWLDSDNHLAQGILPGGEMECGRCRGTSGNSFNYPESRVSTPSRDGQLLCRRAGQVLPHRKFDHRSLYGKRADYALTNYG